MISSFQLFGLWPFYLFPYWTDDRSKVFEQKIVWQVYFPNFFKLHFWANREFSLLSTSIWKNPPTHIIAMCQINFIFVGARISPASQRHTAQKIRIIEIRNKYYLPSTHYTNQLWIFAATMFKVFSPSQMAQTHLLAKAG